MHDINNPAISVIVPVFNRRHLINRAIASVKQQTFTDWELLIVDDGSVDSLEEIVLPQISQHANFRYMKHANRKLSASRNIGIRAALGTYVTFLDSDDEYKPEHLQLRVKYMRQYPNVDILHGGVELRGPEKSHYVQDAFDPSKKIHISECCVGATFFGTREVFLKSGGFKQQPYSAESELLSRLEKRFNVKKVDDQTYIYYTGLDDSICAIRMRESQTKLKSTKSKENAE